MASTFQQPLSALERPVSDEQAVSGIMAWLLRAVRLYPTRASQAHVLICLVVYHHLCQVQPSLSTL